MSNVVFVSDGRSIAAVQQGLARYLPGLDAGLVPLGADRALAMQPSLRALRLEYGASKVPAILGAIGVGESFEVGEEATVALLRARDASALPDRAALRTRPAPPLDWHLALTRVEAAWQRLGGPAAIDWQGVRVGHIDTGYTPHPVFGFPGPTWIDRSFGATFFAAAGPLDDAGPGAGIDPLAHAQDGHGTKTASVICGCAPGAAGAPYYGVAPKVPLVPVRIANYPAIAHAQRQFAQAVDHLIDNARVDVINLSMAVPFGSASMEMRRAVNRAYQSGVVLACAAGNYLPKVMLPARLPRTLAVAGVTPAARPWSGSGCGPEVDVSAPADEIRRADSRPGAFGYDIGDGTSYANAMTSGAAALWFAYRRDEIAAAYALPWQRVEAFTRLVRERVRVPPGWRPGSFGNGILDVDALLGAPLPPAARLVEAPAVR